MTEQKYCSHLFKKKLLTDWYFIYWFGNQQWNDTCEVFILEVSVQSEQNKNIWARNWQRSTKTEPGIRILLLVLIKKVFWKNWTLFTNGEDIDQPVSAPVSQIHLSYIGAATHLRKKWELAREEGRISPYSPLRLNVQLICLPVGNQFPSAIQLYKV